MFSKESLEELRHKIDLIEVLSGHLELQRAGATYKALCPFHAEKTPSFMVKRGDTHYHCFGCGAHGDAIGFLMSYLKMSFSDAAEHLASRFQVILQKEEGTPEEKGPPKALLKEALDRASQFYHTFLLTSEEGKVPLQYLIDRGIDLEFIKRFQIGYAPARGDLLCRHLGNQEILVEAGLMARGRDFFSERITFPIRDPMGSVIGFSARKFKESTFGGKYINTPETPLFKKSQVLFGLSYSRQRIAKEQRAIIVEGQIDALRLIYNGFDYTVAGQGTAFGEGHVRELLHLGVKKIYLALDGDLAGGQAAVKIGHLFQKKGVEVLVVDLPVGSDPDAFVRAKGKEAFDKLLFDSKEYLVFLYHFLAKEKDLTSPAQKNELILQISQRIRDWEQPVLIHESLKKLATLANLPVDLVQTTPVPFPLPKPRPASWDGIDPDRILEADLLRWLVLLGDAQPELIALAGANITPEQLRSAPCRRLYTLYLTSPQRDLLTLGGQLTTEDEMALLSEIISKKVNLQKAKEGLSETLLKLLERRWMDEREEIRLKIQSGAVTEDEALELAKAFDTLKKNPPSLTFP